MIRSRHGLLSLLAALACSASTEPTIDGPMVALTVSGTVRTTVGAPVAGASLAVWTRSLETCTGWFVEARTTSDAGGAFTSTVATWGSDPRDVCVWIAVVPPDGSGLAADTVTVQPARLERVAPTLTVDVVLAARPASSAGSTERAAP